MQVSVRELKNNLSKYLHLVDGGLVVTVTTRKKPTAQILAIPQRGKLQTLGNVRVGIGKPRGAAVKLLKSRISASALVLEDRR